MKIALSADGRSPHTQRWANALVARGHELTVVWPPEYVKESRLAGYRHEVSHIATWSPLCTTRRDQSPIEFAHPARLARRINPDLVQGMNLVKCGWTAVALGRPLVQFAVGSDIVTLGAMPGTSPRRLLGNAYRRWRTLRALRRADAVLCDSSAVAGMVYEKAPRMQVEVIRIGVELASDVSSDRGWRSELRIADDAFVLLSTRLMTSNYNIETIIRAFSIVLRTIPNSVLVLKDFESLCDPAYRERCHRLVVALGLANAVRHVGELARRDLLALYRAADVFLSVPTNDATAVSVMEAMAAYIPVIASRTDGLDPDVLKHEETALLVTAQDEHDLAQAITRLYSAPKLRNRLAQGGQATVRSVGDLEQEVAKAERLYLQLIAADSR